MRARSLQSLPIRVLHFATGWGSVNTEYNVFLTASLNEVDMTVLDDKDCEELNFDEFNTLHLNMGDDMICAGSRKGSNGRLGFMFTFLSYHIIISNYIIHLFSRCSCLLR